MRLIVHVEGRTEETFVNEIIAPHLRSFGYESVSPRIIGNARIRTGGICQWQSARDGIVNHLKSDDRCFATTMVDYYALQDSWPGRKESTRERTVLKKAARGHEAIGADIAALMGKRFNARRFVPFVVMHGFEGLSFRDCAAFCRGIGRVDLERSLRAIRNSFQTPEEINDSSLTAPSKRINELFPGYTKPLYGNIGILEIGLDRIRAQCPHFAAWLTALERSATPSK